MDTTKHMYLIAEDDADTQALVERAFEQLGLAISRHFTSDGQETIDYLVGHGQYRDRDEFPLPCLVLLDFNMPRADGFEVLDWVRQSEFKDLVIVMFSGTSRPQDVKEAYRRGVNSFVEKPVSFHELVQTLMTIHHYWFGCSRLPICGNEVPLAKRESRYKTVTA